MRDDSKVVDRKTWLEDICFMLLLLPLLSLLLDRALKTDQQWSQCLSRGISASHRSRLSSIMISLCLVRDVLQVAAGATSADIRGDGICRKVCRALMGDYAFPSNIGSSTVCVTVSIK